MADVFALNAWRSAPKSTNASTGNTYTRNAALKLNIDSLMDSLLFRMAATLTSLVNLLTCYNFMSWNHYPEFEMVRCLNAVLYMLLSLAHDSSTCSARDIPATRCLEFCMEAQTHDYNVLDISGMNRINSSCSQLPNLPCRPMLLITLILLNGQIY